MVIRLPQTLTDVIVRWQLRRWKRIHSMNYSGGYASRLMPGIWIAWERQ